MPRSSGYCVCESHRRPPVQSWVEAFFFYRFTISPFVFTSRIKNTKPIRVFLTQEDSNNHLKPFDQTFLKNWFFILHISINLFKLNRATIEEFLDQQPHARTINSFFNQKQNATHFEALKPTFTTQPRILVTTTFSIANKVAILRTPNKCHLTTDSES